MADSKYGVIVELTEDELFWLNGLMYRTMLGEIRDKSEVVTAWKAAQKLKAACKHVSGYDIDQD